MVKKALPADLDRLAVLFNAYRIFYRKESDPAGAYNFLKERFDAGDSEIFVFHQGEALAGFVQLYPLFSSVRMKKLWLLNDLFVDSTFRGQGISVALIERAKTLCRDTGACGMFLETEKSNDIGNELYPRAGFTLNAGSNFYDWNV